MSNIHAGGQDTVPPSQPMQPLGTLQSPDHRRDGYGSNGNTDVLIPHIVRRLIVIPENLPQSLRRHTIFCFWRYANIPGRDKPAKIPYSPITGQKLDINEQAAFGTYKDVLNYQERGFDGIGIVVGSGICAIDIDRCRFPGGTWSNMARDICMTMQSYAEVSPSGRGMRILFLASGFQFDKSRYYINNQKMRLEIYIAGATNKYVTVTGHALFSGEDLEERGPQLQTILDKYMVRPTPASPPTPALLPKIPYVLKDEDVITAATRGKNGEAFESLMAGDTSGFDYDHSRADIALCGQLAFYTGKNAEQIDRIFRISGLMRPKWDEQRGDTTYGQMTIQRAIETQQTIYSRAFLDSPPVVLPNLQSANPLSTV